MIKSSSMVVLLVAMMFLISGCAKEPTQEINDAKVAINAAMQSGAQVYTPSEIENLNNQFNTAVEEANAKTGKLFKSNTEAKEKLAKIKADAEALNSTILAKKEEAKNNAINAQKEAMTLLEETKTLLANAPTGKGTQADIEAFNADLKTLEDSLPELQKSIDGEDYFGVIEKVKVINEKVTVISDQIKQAIEKVNAEKSQKKKK